MTVSAESGSLEFGSVFARRSPSAVKFQARSGWAPAIQQYQHERPPPTGSGQAGRLLGILVLAVQKAGPARGERLLHVHVGLLHVAAPFQDLGVDPVAPEQPLLQAELAQLADGELELAVGT